MSKRSNQTNISVLINNQVVEDEMAPCYISTDKANGYEQFLISLLTLEITGAGVVRLWFALGFPRFWHQCHQIGRPELLTLELVLSSCIENF